MDSIKLKKIKKILNEVNSWKDRMSQLTDQQLQEKTEEFRRRFRQGETLDDLLAEAYAVVREVSQRVLGMFPYDVQVMGAIVLLPECNRREGGYGDYPQYLSGNS